MSPCPTEPELRAFLTGAVTAVELESLAEHLDACPSCLQRLGRLDPSADPLVGALRGARPDDTPIDPAVRKLISETPPRSAGARVGPYVLLEKLGEGGMGAVYKVRHDKLGKVFALKLLPPDRHRDPDRAARFEREMRAAGRLEHPHIVRATDAGEHDGVPFLAMELVEGTDLSRLVRRRGPLRPADACEAVRQAALALQHAHGRGLIHRDVKPSNLLLTADGVVKLLDLGLALAADDPAASESPTPGGAAADTHVASHGLTLTATGFALGTREYMAPEQATDPHAVDARADVYGLGATLHFLLTGHAPAESAPLPGELAGVLGRMLAAAPADRFATAGAAAAALARRAKGHDLAAVASGHPPRVRRWRAATAGLILAVGGVVAIAAIREPNPTPDRTPPPGGSLAPVPTPPASDVATRKPPPPGSGVTDPKPLPPGSHGPVAERAKWPPPQPAPGSLPMVPAQAQQLQREWADHLGLRVAEAGPVGVETVLVPPGTFEIYPQYDVTITRPYRLGTTEVTRGQFRAFVNATGYITTGELTDPLKACGQLQVLLNATGYVTGNKPADPSKPWGLSTVALGVRTSPPADTGTWYKPNFRPNDRSPVQQGNDEYPVTHVSHADAEAFVAWLSATEGRKYRLPTEAEWRWAARAGVDTLYPLGNTPGRLKDFAEYDQTPWPRPLGRHPHATGMAWIPGRHRPNAWGLHDMLGNVREWAADDFRPHPLGQGRDPLLNFGLLKFYGMKVSCGGSYNGRTGLPVVGAHPDTCDFHTRKDVFWFYSWREQGFRVCREP